MTTTIMRDSIVGDTWIQQTQAAVPMQRILDQKTGQFKGDVLTGPVRLSFCNLWELPKPKPGDNAEPKYGSMLMFPPNTDFRVLYEEYYAGCAKDFAEYYDAPTQQYSGLHSPFHNQQDKLKYKGFTPGCVYINSSSKYKPPIVDARQNPIVDRNKVYDGVWAICAIRQYSFGKQPPRPKKGVSFGIQSVMIIGDDTKLFGGGVDAKAHYSGVNVAAPIVRPEAMMGMPMAAPAPAAGIPGYTQPGGATYNPAGGQQPMHLPQVHYSGAPMGQPPYAAPNDDDDMSWAQ